MKNVKENCPDYRTDKKHNVRYWDYIDGVIEEAICSIAKASDIEMEEEIVENSLYDDGLLWEVRELIINRLEKNGGRFPFVNENY